MSQHPWVSGPGEILQHGLSLLERDNDKNRRLALLSIDNAVELTIKTFLGLPRRITGINLSRKEFQEISESFTRLLDAIEQHAVDRLNGIDLGEIEWFHRLRNELYHQGNGLTVERAKVEIYAELAKLLFRNLFGFDVEINESEDQDVLGSFLTAWVNLEKELIELGAKHKDHIPGLSERTMPFLKLEEILLENKLLDAKTAQDIELIRAIRNQVIHGQNDYKSILTHELVTRTDALASKVKSLS